MASSTSTTVNVGGTNLTVTMMNNSFTKGPTTVPSSEEANHFFVQLANQPTTSPGPSTTFMPSQVPSMAPTTFEQSLKPSPELTAIGVTIAYSSVVFVIILFGFAIAMRCRSTNIAPRCEARPRNVIYNPDPMCDPVQKKGSPFCLGWVFWVLGLSYKELLGGVPGTGTREGGMKGRMLAVNLDHIILLRFNSLGLKISTVAMLTYITICLPIYYYARCSWVPLGEVDHEWEEEVYQNCTNEQNYTFSSYSRFTLGNVPDLTNDYLTADYHLSSFLLYMVSIASWIVVWFACFEMFHEWLDIVALRRVYYLEYNHWKYAKDEINATMMDAVRESGSRLDTGEKVTESHLFDRPVWIPHPEQRDTPSNIELYSVLVGGIPLKPDQAMNHEDLEAALAHDDSQVDWQMTLVSAFFDSCVPNQPGFSSSVAAVTILPSATELAMAWKSWAKAAKKLSRLRFIRRRIIELGGTPVGQRLVVEDVEKEIARNVTSLRNLHETRESVRRKEYSAEVLGAGIEDDVNDEFWKALDLGPEQIAVYSMEFSKGLAGCCPHGFCEQRISWCRDLDFLLELEADAADAVTRAYAELKEAGHVAATSHEKRKDMLKLTDLTTDLLESKDSLKPNMMQSTTEMQLMKKRRQTHLNRGSVKIGESQFMANATDKRASFGGLEKAESSANNLRGDRSTSMRMSMSMTSSRMRPGFDSGLMRRASAARLNASGTTPTKKVDLWELVECIASESKNYKRRIPITYKVQSGRWYFPTPRRALLGFKRKITSLLSWTGDNSNEATDLLARDSTFAVVTFTSRQAAIAARQCLADGRGVEAFTAEKVHPVPPLADSAAFNACDFRGCTRPVTIGLNEYQKQWRKTLVTIAVAFTYIFYAAPIAILSEYATQAVFLLFPEFPIPKATVDGWLQAQILSIILAFLPEIFLYLANVGSNATSLVEAENAALRFYWYFMLCFAMIGQSIARMFIQIYQSSSIDVQDILETVARTIPVDVSFTWTNWIITRAMTLTPAFYLLQLNSFLFACVGGRCCVRMLKGGGSGNRLPYRIYVENATVLLCTLALAPAAPLLSPFAVLYFLVCTPLLRFCLIFTYKPPFDSGGSRWPLLFDSIIVSLIVAQVLLATILFLKQALGAAIFAMVPVGFVLMFQRRMKQRFLSAYMDAALLQTSMLDGWDVGPDSDHLTWRGREEFRRFIVDAHKASYVPVCIAATQGGGKSQMTAEPAVVVAVDERERREMEREEENKYTDKRAAFKAMRKDKTQQFGALNRRHLNSGRNLSALTEDEPRASLVRDLEEAETAMRGPQSLASSAALFSGSGRKEAKPDDSSQTPSTDTAKDSSPTLSTDDIKPPIVEPDNNVSDSESEQGLVFFESKDRESESDQSYAFFESKAEESETVNRGECEAIAQLSDSWAEQNEVVIDKESVSTDKPCEETRAQAKEATSKENETDMVKEQEDIELQMVPSTTTSPLKVTRLGTINVSVTGELKYDFASDKEKEKDE